MANIQPQIDAIRQARYGRDVRESIASGLEAMNGESSTAYSAAITAQTSATNSATNAAQSATDAANSATVASTAKDDATAAITTVNTYKTEAKASADAAKASETVVNTAAQSAEASKNAAKASESAAALSATNASQSATDARSAYTDASTARTQAQQYATNSATSAAAASNSQTAAASSATNAKASEDAAKNYASQAAAIANIDVMTSTKNGIGRPDQTTIVVNEFGVFSAQGLTEHINDSLVSSTSNPDGAHGVRVYTDPVTGGKSLQTWDSTASAWVDAIKDTKVELIDSQSDLATITETTDKAIEAFLFKTMNNNKANKPTTDTAILYYTSWTGSAAPYTYNLGISATNFDIEIMLPNTATAAQVEAVVNAQISGNGTDNILRAWGDKPTVDIPVVIRKVAK